MNLYCDCSDMVFCFLTKLLQNFSLDCFKQILSPLPKNSGRAAFTSCVQFSRALWRTCPFLLGQITKLKQRWTSSIITDWATQHSSWWDTVWKQTKNSHTTQRGIKSAELQSVIWGMHDFMTLDEMRVWFLMYYGAGRRGEGSSKTDCFLGFV